MESKHFVRVVASVTIINDLRETDAGDSNATSKTKALACGAFFPSPKKSGVKTPQSKGAQIGDLQLVVVFFEPGPNCRALS
jgi:hypothetical protein